MFLHIITHANVVYTDNYILFMRKNFSAKEHMFVALCDIGSATVAEQTNDNIFFTGNSIKRQIYTLRKQIKKSDIVIFHSLFFSFYIFLYLFLHKKILLKSLWIVWGADLYSWRNCSSNKIVNNLYKLCNFILFNTRKNIKYVSAHKIDRASYIEQFGADGTFLEASYLCGYNTDMLLKNYTKKESNDKRIRIMIGHSASKALNHKQVIDMLKSYFNKNIDIVLPLNYGDNKYADDIQQYVNEVFKGNIYVYRKRLSMDEYISLLWSVDIAIFHTNRQIALGNITMLLYMQKKIYISNTSPMYTYFKSQNITVHESEHIDSIDFDELCKNYDNPNGKVFAEDAMDIEVARCRWIKVFEVLKKT